MCKRRLAASSDVETGGLVRPHSEQQREDVCCAILDLWLKVTGKDRVDTLRQFIRDVIGP